MTANDVEALEVQIDQARAAVNLNDDLLALQSVPAFQRVINKGYLEEEAIRLVRAKADPMLRSPEEQAELDNAIIGIGQLVQYFRKISAIANTMERTIKEAEKELELAHQEDV